MKALMGRGLCLVLALVSSRGFAQEAQNGSALPTLGTPSPIIASSVISPVSYNPTPVEADAGVGLGKPIAMSGPSQGGAAVPDFHPAGLTLERPVPLIRGQAPESFMPANRSNQETTSAGAFTVTSLPGRMVPVPVTAASEYESPMPRVMQDSGACGCSCGPVYASTAGIMDCRPLISPADCGCGCFNDCACGDDCGFRGRRIYASASYLGWTFERQNIPPLVTVSPFGTAPSMTGVLGSPTTTVLFGQGSEESAFHSGGRFNLGIWGPAGCWALEVDYLTLSQRSNTSTFGSNGDPQIARPVVLAGQETVEFVSQTFQNPFPQIGSVSVNTRSQLWGIEMNARQKLFCCPCGWVDMLYGYRHLDLSEGISIGENLVELTSPVDNTPLLATKILDQFNTRNVFNGGQIGIQGETHIFPYLFPRLFLGGSLKVALGDMHEQVNINGAIATQALSPVAGPVFTYNQGILANNNNIGNHTADRLAIVPELNLKLGFEINDHWRAWVGYDILYMSSVVRPGDQIDRRISQVPMTNPVTGTTTFVQVPPAGYPAVLFKTTSFYAQGVSFGLQYRW